MLPNDDHLLTRQATVKETNGHKTRPRRSPLTATEAALIAVANGRLSAAQACRLTGANAGYFSIVNGLTDREKELLARGKLTLTELHNGKRNGKHNGDDNGNGERSIESLIEHMRRADVAELMQAVREFGVAKFFDAAIVPILDQGVTEVVVDQA
jgi:hypothetical protein